MIMVLVLSNYSLVDIIQLIIIHCCTLLPPNFLSWLKIELLALKSLQGSHSDWKTWKNGKAFSSQGKVREF